MSDRDTRSSAPSGPPGAAGELETRLLFRSNFILSTAQLALAAIATAFFIGWWALAWFAMMFALIYLRGPGGQKVYEGVLGASFIALGSALNVVAWGAAWLVGGAEASFVAGAMLGVQAMVSTSLFASSRLNFFASYGPTLLVAAAAPFLIFDQPIPVIIVLTCVAHNLVAALAIRANRNQMLEEVLRIQSEFEATRAASLAKSQFIATMSYELRTPLNAVIGYAEILHEDLMDGRQGNAADAERISRAARGQLALIDQILDFSQLEAGSVVLTVGEVDIDRLVHELAQEIAPITTAHGTRVSAEVAVDARRIWTDEVRLRQCVLNLMSNAAKFTQGGCIRVCAAMEVGDRGAMLRIDVSDTGCGISKADQGKLFQPFTQVDGSLTRTEDGAGLGLVITERLSRLLGGGVSFETVEKVGTTFTLRVLARAPKAASAGPEAAALALA